jgi:hypothetical protein
MLDRVKIVVLGALLVIAVAAVIAGCGDDDQQAAGGSTDAAAAERALAGLARDLRTEIVDGGCSEEERMAAEQVIDRTRDVRAPEVTSAVRDLRRAVDELCREQGTGAGSGAATTPPEQGGEQAPTEEGAGSGGVPAPSEPGERGQQGKQGDPCPPGAPPEC